MGEEISVNSIAWETLKANKPEIERLFIERLEQMYQLFVQKNNDYGSDNLFLGGQDGIVLRLGDKISRLWQLVILKKPMEYRWETVKDTLLDVANYAVFGLIMTENPNYKPNIDRKITTTAYIRSLPKEEKLEIVRVLLEGMDD